MKTQQLLDAYVAFSIVNASKTSVDLTGLSTVITLPGENVTMFYFTEEHRQQFDNLDCEVKPHILPENGLVAELKGIKLLVLKPHALPEQL
jgi:hypothetical protein